MLILRDGENDNYINQTFFSYRLYHNFILIAYDTNFIIVETILGDKLKLNINKIVKYNDQYVYEGNNFESEFGNNYIYSDMRIQGRVSLKNSISFKLINAMLLNTKDGKFYIKKKSINTKEYKNQVDKWSIAKKFNLKSKLSNSGFIIIVDSDLMYVYDEYVSNIYVIKEVTGYLNNCRRPPVGTFETLDNLKSAIIISDAYTRDLVLGYSSIEKVDIRGDIKFVTPDLFCNCSDLKEVKLNDGIRVIGVKAFSGCVSLRNINMPKSLKLIDKEAFKNCESITEICLPEGIESVGTGAFSYCGSLEKLVIPKTVTNISTVLTGKYNDIHIYIPHRLVNSFVESHNGLILARSLSLHEI